MLNLVPVLMAVLLILDARSDPAFDVAIEIRGFHDWIIHEDIGKAVDAYLDGASTPAWRHRKQPKMAATSEVSKSSDAKLADELSKSDDAKEEDGGDPTAAKRADEVSKSDDAKEEGGGDPTAAPVDLERAEAEDQLEIVPLVASALPGDAWFEYCALGEGEALPEPGDRQEVKVKFR